MGLSYFSFFWTLPKPTPKLSVLEECITSWKACSNAFNKISWKDIAHEFSDLPVIYRAPIFLLSFLLIVTFTRKLMDQWDNYSDLCVKESKFCSLKCKDGLSDNPLSDSGKKSKDLHFNDDVFIKEKISVDHVNSGKDYHKYVDKCEVKKKTTFDENEKETQKKCNLMDMKLLFKNDKMDSNEQEVDKADATKMNAKSHDSSKDHSRKSRLSFSDEAKSKENKIVNRGDAGNGKKEDETKIAVTDESSLENYTTSDLYKRLGKTALEICQDVKYIINKNKELCDMCSQYPSVADHERTNRDEEYQEFTDRIEVC